MMLHKWAMVRASAMLIALLLATGCQRPVGSEPNAMARREAGPPPAAARLTQLTGRYESGAAVSRLCILDSRFGLVIRGAGGDNCSGSGHVDRKGDAIHFTMQGDSACAFVARTSGRSIVFPAAVPAGCSYYCGPGAMLADTRLAQVGAGRGEAVKTKDLVGGQLCGDG